MFQGATELIKSLHCLTFKSMILNHGAYQNHAHLHLKINVNERFTQVSQHWPGPLQAQFARLQVSILQSWKPGRRQFSSVISVCLPHTLPAYHVSIVVDVQLSLGKKGSRKTLLICLIAGERPCSFLVSTKLTKGLQHCIRCSHLSQLLLSAGLCCPAAGAANQCLM